MMVNDPDMLCETCGIYRPNQWEPCRKCGEIDADRKYKSKEKE